MKCDRCDNQATVHLIEIEAGKKIAKHLCEMHAFKEGVSVPGQAGAFNELLAKFMPSVIGGESPAALVRCEHCGMSWDEFRKGGLLGCPDCYGAFETPLMPLLQRAQEGATRHLGKAPSRVGVDELRRQRLLRLRRELDEAVAGEQFERAAELRDMVWRLEAGQA